MGAAEIDGHYSLIGLPCETVLAVPQVETSPATTDGVERDVHSTRDFKH